VNKEFYKIVFIGDGGCRQVETDRGRELANKYGALFFETSAMTGYNVHECMMEMIREIRKTRPAKQVTNEERMQPNKCLIS
jgi:GTPase SAR1 family protein